MVTGCKYLEIGNDVDSPSYIEIALRDHRGHELSLFLKTCLYEQRWNIYKMLRNENKDNFINVGPSEFARWTMLCRMFDGYNFRTISPTRQYSQCQRDSPTSEDAICDSDIFNGHQPPIIHHNRSSTNCELLILIFNTHEKNDVIKCE